MLGRGCRLGCGQWLARGRATLCVALLSATSPAAGAVYQTDAEQTPLPQPVEQAELALAQAFGYTESTQSFHDPETGELLTDPILYGDYYSPPDYPKFVDGDLFTLAGLFKWRGEQIDPIADAEAGPGHYLPGCGFKVELVLRGGRCEAALGWYNYTGGSVDNVHPLVPQASTYLGHLDLVPRGWDNRDPRDLHQTLWTPQVFSSGDLTLSPAYAGGDVAFALLGDPSTECNVSKFSVSEHNARNTAGVPWVTSLIYRSTVDPTAIYLAFEDLPMSPQDWRDSGSTTLRNDGDFNDAVFFISGLGPCPERACENVTCGPGKTCSDGVCVDDRLGEGGQGGASTGVEPNGAAGETSTSPGGAPSVAGAGLGGGAAPSQGGAKDPGNGGETSGTGSVDAPGSTSKGCGCRLSPSESTPGTSFGLALAAVLALRRRRPSGILRLWHER
jgi:MYXO-CTERM domain-containing protein